jgi:hypothetical protein
LRKQITPETLRALMAELARTAPRGQSYRVYVVGGSTAVLAGWRSATIDADLFGERQEVFRDVQGIKERLRLNIEFARPEHFVPALAGSSRRHRFIERIGTVGFYHYDPYAQLLSKIVRGFRKDLEDARDFVKSGWVDAERFQQLVDDIPDAAYVKYPNLSRRAVRKAVDAFLTHISDGVD